MVVATVYGVPRVEYNIAEYVEQADGVDVALHLELGGWFSLGNCSSIGADTSSSLDAVFDVLLGLIPPGAASRCNSTDASRRARRPDMRSLAAATAVRSGGTAPSSPVVCTLAVPGGMLS